MPRKSPAKNSEAKLGDQTMFSLQFVVIVMGVAVWLIRIDDKNTHLEKKFEDAEHDAKVVSNMVINHDKRLDRLDRWHDWELDKKRAKQK